MKKIKVGLDVVPATDESLPDLGALCQVLQRVVIIFCVFPYFVIFLNSVVLWVIDLPSGGPSIKHEYMENLQKTNDIELKSCILAIIVSYFLTKCSYLKLLNDSLIHIWFVSRSLRIRRLLGLYYMDKEFRGPHG